MKKTVKPISTNNNAPLQNSDSEISPLHELIKLMSAIELNSNEAQLNKISIEGKDGERILL